MRKGEDVGESVCKEIVEKHSPLVAMGCMPGGGSFSRLRSMWEHHWSYFMVRDWVALLAQWAHFI